MNILITGASGFIGSSFLKKLATTDNKVLCISRTKPLLNHKNRKIEWFKGDLNNPNEIKDKIIEFKPIAVFHLSWEGIPELDSINSIKNLFNSIKLFEIIFECNSCKKIIIPGSCFEYSKKTGLCKESESLAPSDYFTWAKLSLYEYLKMESIDRNISLAWFRLFYVYGPLQRKGSLIPTLIESIKKNKCPDLRTPKNRNDFIYVDEVSELFFLALSSNFSTGIYNAGSGQSTSVTDICSIIENSISSNNLLTDELKLKSKNSSVEVDFYASNRKVQNNFGWRNATSIEDGIKKVIDSSN
tara:strand:+ start:149 stop:1048 length:900 start_codon:yes stop_codon:yes gene_type:complete